MNKLELTTHHALLVNADKFGQLPFKTIQLQSAIVKASKNGFPKQPIGL